MEVQRRHQAPRRTQALEGDDFQLLHRKVWHLGFKALEWQIFNSQPGQFPASVWHQTEGDPSPVQPKRQLSESRRGYYFEPGPKVRKAENTRV